MHQFKLVYALSANCGIFSFERDKYVIPSPNVTLQENIYVFSCLPTFVTLNGWLFYTTLL